jgi:hypothetical protein
LDQSEVCRVLPKIFQHQIHYFHCRQLIFPSSPRFFATVRLVCISVIFSNVFLLTPVSLLKFSLVTPILDLS